MMTRLLTIFLLLLTIACDKEPVEEGRPDLDGKIAIRILNASIFTYEDIEVDTNGGNNNYGQLSPFQVSNYQLFDFAYRYAFVELIIDGRIATLQPIDFFGEKKLESGYYTYRIEANDSSARYGRLSLELIED